MAREVEVDWSADDIPSLAGKTAIVTGANAGVGFETALALAKHGAHVVLACRSASKANDAAKSITDAIGDGSGSVEVLLLDLSSLKSVREFCAQFRAKHDKLHVLINNAGVFGVPFSLSVDGIERQFATNYLGHFVLTAELFDLLKTTGHARIVNVCSLSHREGKIVSREQLVPTEPTGYVAGSTYNQSKLYIILFTKELARRLEAKSITDVVVASCHPGACKTNALATTAAENGGVVGTLWKIWSKMPGVFQDAASGALPSLYAATAAGVKNGDFYGPKRLRLWGPPVLEEPNDTANSIEFARIVWEESERLGGLTFAVE